MLYALAYTFIYSGTAFHVNKQPHYLSTGIRTTFTTGTRRAVARRAHCQPAYLPSHPTRAYHYRAAPPHTAPLAGGTTSALFPTTYSPGIYHLSVAVWGCSSLLQPYTIMLCAVANMVMV